MSNLKKARLILTPVIALFMASVGWAANTAGVQITKLPDRLRIEINGQLFTEYYYENVHCPYYYPLLGPYSLPMTRKWPMENPPGEEHDHPHQRSLWFSHGIVNGQDFWTDRAGTKIVDDGHAEITSGKEFGMIRSRDEWVAADGKVLCTDDRTFKVYNSGSTNERVFDFEITIHASNGEVVFGDSKEGTMALRVAESMKLKAPGHGHISLSTGVRDEATWGKRADWCDYSGPVENKTVGIAIFDSPQNPHHPTWWMVRDYGLFAANPFGQHSLESLPATADLKIAAGQSVTFRYRFYLHEGDEKQARVAERYEQYSNSK